MLNRYPKNIRFSTGSLLITAIAFLLLASSLAAVSLELFSLYDSVALERKRTLSRQTFSLLNFGEELLTSHNISCSSFKGSIMELADLTTAKLSLIGKNSSKAPEKCRLVARACLGHYCYQKERVVALPTLGDAARAIPSAIKLAK